MRVAAVLSSFLALDTVAHGQARAAIQSQYDRFAKAYVKNDVPTMLKILRPKYVITNEQGVAKSYKEYRKQLEDRKKSGKTSQAYTVQIEKLTREGDTATVETSEVTTAKDGTETVHKYLDVWQKSGSKWQLVSTKTREHG